MGTYKVKDFEIHDEGSEKYVQVNYEQSIKLQFHSSREGKLSLIKFYVGKDLHYTISPKWIQYHIDRRVEGNGLDQTIINLCWEEAIKEEKVLPNNTPNIDQIRHILNQEITTRFSLKYEQLPQKAD